VNDSELMEETDILESNIENIEEEVLRRERLL